MKDKELENLLQKYSFTKSKNNDQYYLTTPIVLDKTADCLVIVAKIEKEKIILSDNTQLFDAYLQADEEIEYLKNKIEPKLEKNMFLKFLSINMYANEQCFGIDLSIFIKKLIHIETLLKEE